MYKTFVRFLTFCAIFTVTPVQALAGLGPKAWVIDQRIAALRTEPFLSARLVKRLRTGRMAVVVEQRKDREGRFWLRVAVTRRTRGWIVASAIARPGNPEAEARLLSRIEATGSFERIALARLAWDQFPRLRGHALAVLDDEAEKAAIVLTRRVLRRIGSTAALDDVALRELMLSDSLLDRYNRLGITFDVETNPPRFVARGARRAAFRLPESYARLARSCKGARIQRCKQLSWREGKAPG